MTINIYDTHTLQGVIRNIKPVNQFWLSLAFPNVQTFDTEYIDFDVLNRGRRMAPFVSPSVQGKVIRHEGYTTKRFAPAYSKMKSIVDPRRVLKRMAGEAYTGSLSPEARRNAIVADILATHMDMHTRRLEWMAASAVITGAVTVSGENYPTQVVDFGRAANQTVALTGGNQWGQAGVKPLDLLESWCERVAESSGYLPTDAIMGLDAWRVFRTDADVVKALDTNYRGSSAVLNLFEPDPRSPAQPWSLRGRIGNLNIWTYNDLVEDDAGNTTSLLDQKTVVLVNAGGLEGIRAFSAVLDPENNYASSEMFAKNWIEKDPPVEFLMTQHAPLTVLGRPNASMAVKVLE